MKFRQPSLGTKAATFLPFLINCTRTALRTAELGCLDSIPLWETQAATRNKTLPPNQVVTKKLHANNNETIFATKRTLSLRRYPWRGMHYPWAWRGRWRWCVPCCTLCLPIAGCGGASAACALREFLSACCDDHSASAIQMRNGYHTW